ncbi:hypothetical protein WISP_00351 [Willisornis vidua]|uniref:Uncharacterized protein n=1 Tax=Willisornis vidua TaxID=1566151 RepID=A0ABQ9DVL2_9PASS|nr:hypothetical protein WISP_00351 [Willisornis vidua]
MEAAMAAPAPAELRVLVWPRSLEPWGVPRGAARARLSRAQDALGSLLAPGGISVQALPGGAGRARGAALPGAWAE